jgi:hypothetical protein
MATVLTNLAISFKDAVTDVGTSQLYPLGTLREQEGQSYRYVKRNDSTVAFAAGDLVYRVGSTVAVYWNVSGDISDQDAAFVAGVAQGSIADGGYGWIKTKGLVTNLKKKAGTAGFTLVKGDFLIPAAAATDDGRAQRFVGLISTLTLGALRAQVMTSIRKVLERVVGHAAAAASGATVACSAYIDLE